MAIPIPVTQTKVATASWGIPITNEVNRLTTQSDTNKTDIAALKTATAVGAWQLMTMQNGWTHHSASHQVKIRKVGDIVYVRGVASGGTLGTVMFTLPVGYRPVHDHGFPVYSGSSTSPAYVTSEPSGAVTAQVTGALGAFIYLDPCSWSITA